MSETSLSYENEKVVNHNFFKIMEEIGWMGKFTIRLFFIMYVIVIYGAMNIVGSVFLSAGVSHHCEIRKQVEDYVSKACHIKWNDIPLNLSIPLENGKLSQCKIYNSSVLLDLPCSYWNMSSPSNFTSTTCTKWWYNRTVFSSTAAMDFNLVCDNQWLQELSQFLLMFGVLIGATAFGICSDKWGRRPCFIVSLIILMISSILTSVFKVFWLHTIARLFVGVGSIGLCISGVVYTMEVITVQYRVLLNQTLQASFSLGFMLLALLAYFERRWVYLNLYLSLPLVPLLPLYIYFSAESPRWLLSKNKTKEAISILKRIASVNGKDFCQIIDSFKSEKDSSLKLFSAEPEKLEVANKKFSTLDLFRNPSLRIISLVLFYNWFTVTCIYYGLTLNTSSLSGNVFLNFFLGGLVEIPANFGVIPVIHYWGRRPVICVCNIICGISLVCMMFVRSGMTTLNVIFFLVGKFGVTATFSCIYLYSSELYPTPLRGNGLGVCSGFSRLGGLVSLLVIMLRHISPNLPFAVFGVIAALAGVLIVLLPETKGTPLPETIEDTEHLHKNRRTTLLKQFVPATVRAQFA